MDGWMKVTYFPQVAQAAVPVRKPRPTYNSLWKYTLGGLICMQADGLTQCCLTYKLRMISTKLIYSDTWKRSWDMMSHISRPLPCIWVVLPMAIKRFLVQTGQLASDNLMKTDYSELWKSQEISAWLASPYGKKNALQNQRFSPSFMVKYLYSNTTNAFKIYINLKRCHKNSRDVIRIQCASSFWEHNQPFMFKNLPLMILPWFWSLDSCVVY